VTSPEPQNSGVLQILVAISLGLGAKLEFKDIAIDLLLLFGII